jgi:hypothetical protein
MVLTGYWDAGEAEEGEIGIISINIIPFQSI